MKRIYASLALALLTFSAFAQTGNDEADFAKNKVKLNLFALPLKNFSLQYERGLTENMSVCLGLRLQPKGGLPFRSSISNAFDEEDTTAQDLIDNVKASSWGITPEFRYYFGKKPLSGFYLAPYVRVGGNSLEWTYSFRMDDGNMKRVDFNGKINSVYAGLLLGAQWHVAESFVIDWWIAGPSYGSMNIKLEANTDMTDLSADDRRDLEESLDGIGYGGHELETDINDNGVRVKGKLPMFGLRTGLCIGYTF